MPSYVREDEKINRTYAKKTAALITIIFGGFIFLCLISGGTWFGGFGELLNNFFLGVFGNSSYPVFVLLLLISLMSLFGKQVAGNRKCFIAVLFLIFFTMMIVHLSTTTGFFSVERGFAEYMDYCYNSVVADSAFVTGGGAFFGIFVFPLAKYLGISGAYILISLLFLATVVFVVNYYIARRKIKNQTPEYGNRRKEYPVDVPELSEDKPAEVRRPKFYPNKKEKVVLDEEEPIHVQNKMTFPQGEMFVANIVNEDQYIEKMRAKEIPNHEEKAVEEVMPVSYIENFQSELIERKKYAMPSKKYPIDDSVKTVMAEDGLVENDIQHSPILADFYASKKELPKEEKAKEVSGYRININEIKKQYPQSEPIISAKKYAERKHKEYYEKKNVEPKDDSLIYNENNNDEGFLFKSIYDRKKEEELKEIDEMEKEIRNLSDNFDQESGESVNMKKLMQEAEALKTEEPSEAYFNGNVFKSKNSNFENSKSEYESIDLTKEIKNYLNVDAVKNKKFSLPGSKNLSEPQKKADEEVNTLVELKSKSPFRKISRYVKPPIDLLQKSVPMDDELRKESSEKALILEETLNAFKIDAEVRGITQGPTVTRYELYVGTGVPVKKILSIADDIAMRLEAEGGIRIQAPIPGKNLLGIEVPNRVKQIVRLRDIIESKEFRNRKSDISFALGKDIAGENMICDLGKMPHLLIAGTTGAGKSACLDSLIVSIILNTSPEDVRFILIDPKLVEFATYEGLPHLLLENIVVEHKKALSAFNWAINEMERRYELFQELKIKDIGSYNVLADENNEARLPKIIIIVDEVADLLLANKVELEEKIMRLTQKARAAGIHLVLATQRPSVDVITGVIKANLPSRIALKVPDPQTSKTVINMGGAEKLLGQGDMLFMDASALVRIQGSYVSTGEVKEIVKYIIDNNESDFNSDVEREIVCEKEEVLLNEDEDNVIVKEKELDAYFVDALRMGIEKDTISLSMVQRKFSVGYARAGKIIDTMEDLGYISEANGAKPRKILITREQFEEIYGKLD